MKGASPHAQLAGLPTALWERATFPLLVPPDAKLFAFDFKVAGDAQCFRLRRQ